MRRILLLPLLAVALGGCGGDAPEAREAGGPRALVEALRDGGHVLYLRHALTDHTQSDALAEPLRDCGLQRNLTEEGRRQARALGEAIEALGIPVGAVLSSEYCRCLDTARLAFDRAEPVPLLSGIPAAGERDHAARVAALRELLSEPPPADTNRVVVAHKDNLEDVAGVVLDEGETAVFEPLGNGEFRFAGRVPAAVWTKLAAALAEA
ncbi:MAG TPA: histidine phosphatase family protein [Gaiellaceae bacterium]|nr:histidine phosphatase family protein [Gaiellaceae bacterium]